MCARSRDGKIHVFGFQSVCGRTKPFACVSVFRATSASPNEVINRTHARFVDAREGMVLCVLNVLFVFNFSVYYIRKGQTFEWVAL